MFWASRAFSRFNRGHGALIEKYSVSLWGASAAGCFGVILCADLKRL